MIFVHTLHVILGSKIHTLRYEGFKRVKGIPLQVLYIQVGLLITSETL